MADNKMTVTHEKVPEVRKDYSHFTWPAVDIYETDDALTLSADLPGAAKERLDINIDQGILTIEAEVSGERGGKEVFDEFAINGYYRQFRLPDHLDPSRTDAELRDGVLTLTIPKAEAAKPRRIEVKTVH